MTITRTRAMFAVVGMACAIADQPFPCVVCMIAILILTMLEAA